MLGAPVRENTMRTTCTAPKTVFSQRVLRWKCVYLLLCLAIHPVLGKKYVRLGTQNKFVQVSISWNLAGAGEQLAIGNN